MLSPSRPGGAQQPGLPSALRPAANAITLPPDQFAPPGSQPLYAIAPPTVVGPGPAALWAVPAGIITTLQAQQVARITQLTCQVLNLLATSIITFTLREGGAPVAGGTFRVAAAPLAVAFFPFPIYRVTGQGAVVDVMVQVDDGAAYTVQAYYQGWVYAAQQQLQFYGTTG